MGRLFPDGTRRPLRAAALLMGLLAAAGDAASPAFALSDLQTIPGDAQQQTPAGTPEGQAPAAGPTPQAPAAQAPANPGGSIPRPDPLVAKPPAAASGAKPAEAQPKPVEVLTDISKIPAPVARMRQLIVEAAASGDVERLRALLGKGPTQTVIGDNEEEDPIEAIKGLSGDSDGLEILAIMLDLLSTGFVKMDAGTPDEVYVWPYFVAKPLASLTPPEKVDLMRLVTAGDVMAMQEFGSYNFYRIGISPDGQWKFLSGGD
ncbi:hypothetical protein BJF93_17145 [Xaviernesmea oryzae]|uniref:Uncharacterized protein n=1 Tax=Xaviernesmea oryzae TaxID=464029 RepID=A0A1Q9ATP0_9HYPH|nr:hypothetical protein [Xaviernesmea oryzae]OLP58783.1 hypothetical protein BJF93_17145 [Xaviernesmea oryzae]